MTRLHVLRGLAATIAAACAVVACGSSSTNAGPSNLAAPADQVLKFPIIDDVGTLDPGHVSAAVDITFTNEMYDGLYKFDNDLKIVPDIATGMPTVSADGLTYTFHLRHDAKFWNGDPVTAQDFLYSWNRAAYLNDSYATVFQPVVGFDKVTAATNPAKTMDGLTAPDNYTIVAKLTSPAGFWLTELALWTADVVDQKVIGDYTDKNNPNEDTWWTKPDTAVGSGPFKMVARTPKSTLEFKPVAGWWGGNTGHLTDVQVEVLSDQASQVQKFNAGGFNVIGPANNAPDLADIQAFLNNPAKKSQVVIRPSARTTWVGFNFINGPLKGDASNSYVGTGSQVTSSDTTDNGLMGRQALAYAIDRSQMVNVACSDILCTPATGGVITKGLAGYLGDGADPLAKFDKTKAQSLYNQWDPNKTKLQGQVFWYNTTSLNNAWAQNLVAQWQANLGLNIQVQSLDFPTFLKRRQNKEYTFFRDSWGADYNHPQDWFDNLFTCAAAPPGHGNNDGYCNQKVDQLVAQADAKQLTDAVSLYQQAQQQMVQDAEFAALFYGTTPYFISPKVQGAGANPLYDYRWEPIDGSSGIYVTK